MPHIDVKQFNPINIFRSPTWVLSILIMLTTLFTLACGLIDGPVSSNNKQIVVQSLSTLTPTSYVKATHTVVSDDSNNSHNELSTVSAIPKPAVDKQNHAGQIENQLTTLTPTPENSQVSDQTVQPVAGESAGLPSTPMPTSAPAAQPNQPTASPTTPPTPTSTATPSLENSGWSFASIRTYPDEAGNLLLYGDVINNTGSSQEVAYITGDFYNAEGQPIADQDQTIDYWPIDVIPAGERLPFELTVLGVQNITNYELNVTAHPSQQILSQNFEFLDVTEFQDEESYCLVGLIKNIGPPLQEYVVVVGVLYDNQNQVLQFGEYYQSSEELNLNEAPFEFSLCIDLINADIARYDLRAWGI